MQEVRGSSPLSSTSKVPNSHKKLRRAIFVVILVVNSVGIRGGKREGGIICRTSEGTSHEAGTKRNLRAFREEPSVPCQGFLLHRHEPIHRSSQRHPSRER